MNLIAIIKGFFSSLLRKFKAFIAAALPAVKQIIIAQLKDIALETVKYLAVTDLSNEEKRSEAFKKIKEYAVLKGIAAKDSLINTVIELAYQQVQGE
jgi:hypothetical protein